MLNTDSIIEKILQHEELDEIPLAYKIDMIHIVREVLEEGEKNGLL